jgi:hypothetical protein
MITTNPTPCWYLTNPDGSQHAPDDPGPAHYDTREEALNLGGTYVNEPVDAAQFGFCCIIAACNGCGEGHGDDEWSTVHYPSPDLARDMLPVYDYVVSGDDVWCDNCKTTEQEI